MNFNQYKNRKKKDCSRFKPVDLESQVAHIGSIPSATDSPPYIIRPLSPKKYLSYINKEGRRVYAKQITISHRSMGK